ncbi:MAG: ATP-binding protein [Candidatus Parvibacillus calidus]|nr:MAG: ATP-binding protein [Candidatus Parvibacillus calidus]
MNSRKVYAIDNAVVKRIGINFSPNIGRLMENVVFIELQRRQKKYSTFRENMNVISFL